MPMTPDEVVKELKEMPKNNIFDDVEKEVIQSAISLISDYQKLRGKVDKLELIKIADKSLGYNGLGTKMTPKEIDKMFSAIVTYLEGGKE
jgi:hypothetical protein